MDDLVASLDVDDLAASQAVAAHHRGASAGAGEGDLGVPCPVVTGTMAAPAGDLYPGVRVASLAVAMARVAAPVADVNPHQGASAAGAAARPGESMDGWALAASGMPVDEAHTHGAVDAAWGDSPVVPSDRGASRSGCLTTTSHRLPTHSPVKEPRCGIPHGAAAGSHSWYRP